MSAFKTIDAGLQLSEDEERIVKHDTAKYDGRGRSPDSEDTYTNATQDEWYDAASSIPVKNLAADSVMLTNVIGDMCTLIQESVPADHTLAIADAPRGGKRAKSEGDPAREIGFALYARAVRTGAIAAPKMPSEMLAIPSDEVLDDPLVPVVAKTSRNTRKRSRLPMMVRRHLLR